MPKTTIKFHRGYSPYVTGDVATFPSDQAERFVKGGYANRQMTAEGPVGQRPAADPLPPVQQPGRQRLAEPEKAAEPVKAPAEKEPASVAPKATTRQRIRRSQ